MGIILYTTLIGAVLSNKLSQNTVSVEEASNVLKTGRLFGRPLQEQLRPIKKKWHNICKFDSTAKLEEFKDELEETSLPESEVDGFERCILKCKIADFGKDFLGNAYEEKREDWEEESQVSQCYQIYKCYATSF